MLKLGVILCFLVATTYACTFTCGDNHNVNKRDANGAPTPMEQIQARFPVAHPNHTAPTWCGTGDNHFHADNPHMAEMMKPRRQFSRIDMPVRINPIVDTNGNGAGTQAQYESMIDDLNFGYNHLNIYFYLYEVNVIVDSAAYNGFYNDWSSTQQSTFNANHGLDMNAIVNIYSSRGNSGQGGFAYFWQRNLCCNFAMLNADLWGSSSMRKVVIHELGHHFGLPHTFQGGCSEPGDGISDTPQEATSHSSCTARDSCPNDGLGNDDIDNYMAYTWGCPNGYSFTPGQGTFMYNYITNDPGSGQKFLGGNFYPPNQGSNPTTILTTTQRNSIVTAINNARGNVAPAADQALSDLSYTNALDLRLDLGGFAEVCSTSSHNNLASNVVESHYIATGDPTTMTGTQLVQRWLDQQSSYSHSTFTTSAADYINLVRAVTTQFGCTLVDCTQGSSTPSYSFSCYFRTGQTGAANHPPYVEETQCTSPTCSTTAACPASFTDPCTNTFVDCNICSGSTPICVNGACQSLTDYCCQTQNNYECGTITNVSPTDQCYNVQCPNTCGNDGCNQASMSCDANCVPAGQCTSAICGPASGCEVACGCPSGDVCNAGTCETPPSCGNTDCRADQVCVSNNCVCPSGTSENNGVCVANPPTLPAQLSQIVPDGDDWELSYSSSVFLRYNGGNELTRLEWTGSDAFINLQGTSVTAARVKTTGPNQKVGFTIFRQSGSRSDDYMAYFINTDSNGQAKLNIEWVYFGRTYDLTLGSSPTFNWAHHVWHSIRCSFTIVDSSLRVFFTVDPDGNSNGDVIPGYIYFPTSYYPDFNAFQLYNVGGGIQWEDWLVGSDSTLRLVASNCLTETEWRDLALEAAGLSPTATGFGSITINEITDSGSVSCAKRRRQTVPVEPGIPQGPVGSQATVTFHPNSQMSGQATAQVVTNNINHAGTPKAFSSGVTSVSAASPPVLPETGGIVIGSELGSSGGGGLSTGAIIGIAAGGAVAVGLAVLAAALVVAAVVAGVIIVKKKSGGSVNADPAPVEMKTDPRHPRTGGDVFDFDDEENKHKSITNRVPEGYSETVQYT